MPVDKCAKICYNTIVYLYISEHHAGERSLLLVRINSSPDFLIGLGIPDLSLVERTDNGHLIGDAGKFSQMLCKEYSSLLVGYLLIGACQKLSSERSADLSGYGLELFTVLIKLFGRVNCDVAVVMSDAKIEFCAEDVTEFVREAHAAL